MSSQFSSKNANCYEDSTWNFISMKVNLFRTQLMNFSGISLTKCVIFLDNLAQSFVAFNMEINEKNVLHWRNKHILRSYKMLIFVMKILHSILKLSLRSPLFVGNCSSSVLNFMFESIKVSKHHRITLQWLKRLFLK